MEGQRMRVTMPSSRLAQSTLAWIPHCLPMCRKRLKENSQSPWEMTGQHQVPICKILTLKRSHSQNEKKRPNREKIRKKRRPAHLEAHFSLFLVVGLSNDRGATDDVYPNSTVGGNLKHKDLCHQSPRFSKRNGIGPDLHALPLLMGPHHWPLSLFIVIVLT